MHEVHSQSYLKKNLGKDGFSSMNNPPISFARANVYFMINFLLREDTLQIYIPSLNILSLTFVLCFKDSFLDLDSFLDFAYSFFVLLINNNCSSFCLFSKKRYLRTNSSILHWSFTIMNEILIGI